MIITALNNYYEILYKNNLVPPFGFSFEKVSFELNINKNGELTAIIPLEDEIVVGNRTYSSPKIFMLPQSPADRTGSKIVPCFLYDNPEYVLGLSGEKEKERIRAEGRFNEFKKYHQDLIGDKSEIGKIFLKFLDTYSFEKYQEIIEPFFDELMKGSKIVFRVDGKYLHEDEDLKAIWLENLYENINQGIKMQCCITGKEKFVARIHRKIKGVKDGQTSGASIVSFNEDAYESYSKTQNYNAPISEVVAFNYTTTLNYLLSSPKNKIQIGDATTVFWAESDDSGYVDVMMMILNPPTEKNKNRVVDIRTEENIMAMLDAVRKGKKVNYSALNLNPATKCYILGLSPNKARIAIRFFYHNTFQELIDKCLLHYYDMRIEKSSQYDSDNISILDILDETLNPNATKEKHKPLLSGYLMRSILSGTLYPRILLNLIIERVKKDQDKEGEKNKRKAVKKINYKRVSIIKAYLNRYARIYKNEELKEVLNMSLNRESKNIPYLLGRLFAILEKAQKDAIPEINTTIKDKYFSSACSTPSAVFPTLLKLAQTHISKTDYGYVHEKRISEIMEMMDDTKFPSHLKLDDQGVFIIGYYHQTNDFYKKNNKKGE